MKPHRIKESVYEWPTFSNVPDDVVGNNYTHIGTPIARCALAVGKC